MSAGLRSATSLFVGILIFVGLPLLGWGVLDVQGFLAHPARLSYTMLVVLLQIFFMIKMPQAGRGRGVGKKTVRRQHLVVVLMQVLSLAIMIAAPFSDRHTVAVLGDFDIVRYLGLVLFALGTLMMNWSAAILDKQFSVEVTIQEGHRLITDGPYRYLRHPRYLGIIVFNVGLSLVFRSWLGLILVAALTLVLLWRIHDEEALMHEAFGTDWEAYSRRSSRLIPFVF